MHLIDLLNINNYVSYNVKIAQVFGLKTAVYISVLIQINNKAITKNKLFEGDFFKIDRKYVTEVTTLETEEQIEIENKLNSINILAKKGDLLKIDVNVLTGILNTNKTTLNNISNIVKKEKRTKRQAIADNLKNYIVCSNEELLEAYKNWIDGVYSNPNGFLSKRSIEIFQHQLNDYTKGDLDLALAILDIATVNGHRDVKWSIDEYEKRNKNNYKKVQPQSQIIKNTSFSEEVY